MSFQSLIVNLYPLIAVRIPRILMGVALLVFIWGLVKFLNNAGDKKGLEEGRNIMIWGVLALFVMVTVWGLIFFIQDELGIVNISL